MTSKAICDGRGNAGTGARAVVLFHDGQVIERAEKITPTTNIVAEHLAIQLALEVALDAGVRRLVVWNDSQTPVFQIQGKYGVKSAHLKPIIQKTLELGEQFEEVSIEWVPRAKTKLPDQLCRDVDKAASPRKRPGGAKKKRATPQFARRKPNR